MPSTTKRVQFLLSFMEAVGMSNFKPPGHDEDLYEKITRVLGAVARMVQAPEDQITAEGRVTLRQANERIDGAWRLLVVAGDELLALQAQSLPLKWQTITRESEKHLPWLTHDMTVVAMQAATEPEQRLESRTPGSSGA